MKHSLCVISLKKSPQRETPLNPCFIFSLCRFFKCVHAYTCPFSIGEHYIYPPFSFPQSSRCKQINPPFIFSTSVLSKNKNKMLSLKEELFPSTPGIGLNCCMHDIKWQRCIFLRVMHKGTLRRVIFTWALVLKTNMIC